MGLVRREDGTVGYSEWPLPLRTPIEVVIAQTGVAQKASATSVPCAQVLVQPKRNTTGVGTNANMVTVGNTTAQLLQVSPEDFGVWIPCSDLDRLYVKGTAGQSVIITPVG